MRLDGETALVPIVGDPIAQVKSPALLSADLQARGLNAIVPPAHVAPEDFGSFIMTMKRTRNVRGLVLTVPHKFAGLAYCDRLSERAAFVNAVNVLRRGTDGAWEGDALDGEGYLAGIARHDGSVTGRSVLLLGAGGAGSAIAFAFLEQGVSRLSIHDADAGRRDALVARLGARFGNRVSIGDTDPTGFEIVANATPMGMKPDDPLPVDVSRLTRGQFVACCITRPEVSPLIAAAREHGCTTMTGLGMFHGVADRMVAFFAEGVPTQ